MKYLIVTLSIIIASSLWAQTEEKPVLTPDSDPLGITLELIVDTATAESYFQAKNYDYALFYYLSMTNKITDSYGVTNSWFIGAWTGALECRIAMYAQEFFLKDESEELLKRIQELEDMHELVHNSPDNPWYNLTNYETGIQTVERLREMIEAIDTVKAVYSKTYGSLLD